MAKRHTSLSGFWQVSPVCRMQGAVTSAGAGPVQFQQLCNRFEAAIRRFVSLWSSGGRFRTIFGRLGDGDLLYSEKGYLYCGRWKTMTGGRQGYEAYLLRLWQVHSGGRSVWRAALESPHTGERWTFGDLAGLIAHLERQTGGLHPVELAEDRPSRD